jgi:phage terminase large subunit-like protein
VWAVPASKQPQPIAWDMRSHRTEFAEAVETCEAEILEGQFKHDGNAVTARHVGNARRRPQNGRVSIAKESKDSPRKIDAAVCVVGARMVRRIALAAAPKKQRTGEASFW